MRVDTISLVDLRSKQSPCWVIRQIYGITPQPCLGKPQLAPPRLITLIHGGQMTTAKLFWKTNCGNLMDTWWFP